MRGVKNKKLKNFLYFFAVSLLAFLSLNRALRFHFWRDDWGQLWAAVYRPDLLLHELAAIRLHPGSAIEQFLLAKILAFKSFYWQVYGIILRIFDAIAVFILIKGLTNSYRASVLGGLFFASLAGGLESFVWVSAHTSAILIFFFSLACYFWCVSNKLEKHFIYSLIFLTLAVFTSPGRALFLVALLTFWDFLSAVSHDDISLRRIVFRNLSMFLYVFILLRLATPNGFFSFNGIYEKWAVVMNNKAILKNFFNSVGNLLTGWFLNISETGSLSNPNVFTVRVGFFTFFILVFLFFLFIFKKRSHSFKVIIFSLAWIFVPYFPNWLFDQTLVLGTSHRYLTLSSVGVVILFSFLISLLKNKKAGILLSVIFVIFNIIRANKILAEQGRYRDYVVVENLWLKINGDVPEGEVNSIFMYGGGDYLRGVALDWSFSVPFGIKRGFKNLDDFPIVTGDRELIKKLICGEMVERPSVGKWSLQKEPIPISHIHAWELNNGVLTNVSDKQRNLFLQEANCELK
jgi:hypothetical protein